MGGPSQISAGGGQMVSCRDVARVGQLMLNKGKWLDKSGAAFQMASEKHIEAMVKVSDRTHAQLFWLLFLSFRATRVSEVAARWRGG